MVRQIKKTEMEKQFKPREYARIRSKQLDLAKKGLVLESARYAIEAARIRDNKRMYA
ncbi:hypothetical protein JD969_06650 [Planctomycetota bacterium]|nr:hypothetical protein JD969_06650 [Planctomycetota bacterium]